MLRNAHLRLVILNVMVASVTSCGGGGGGGGASSAGPIITSPSPPIIGSAAAELANTPSLALVQANAIYEDQSHGDGSQVAVLDSGVYANHAELRGRVIGGGDFQDENEDGTVDPFGHGTHVASIIAAAKDKIGMHGVVPEAEIVSYRILNSSGYFGSKSGNDMLPVIMGDVASRNLPVVNNSWSSFYEINDFDAATIESSLEEELNAYRSAATADGPVLVWAAGNGSDNNVSVRSGLPYYFPELEQNWLAVVAVDQNGQEPSYTNRCGISAEWCVTAPGGGDNKALNGVEAASNTGGYTRKSGTSMAAPIVSGAITLVMEAMPTLTPRQAIIRIKATATHEGLRSSDGCTKESCSESQMQAIFGHGLIQVEDAIQPIGDASIISSSSQHTPAPTTYLQTPSIIGDSIADMLDGSVAVVRDDFDGAMFLTPIAHRVLEQPANSRDSFALMTSDAALATFEMPMGYLASFSRSAPSASGIDASLLDVPTAQVEGWHGINLSDKSTTLRMMFGHGEDRQALHLIYAKTKPTLRQDYWIGGGVDQTNDWMDGRSSGVLDVRGARSQWAFAGHKFPLGTSLITAEMLIGKTDILPSQASLLTEGTIIYDAWSLRVDQQIGRFDWGAKFHQPPALRSGYILLDQPVTISEDHVGFAPRKYDLRLNAREQRGSINVATKVKSAFEVRAEFSHVKNYGHLKGRQDNQAQIAIKYEF